MVKQLELVKRTQEKSAAGQTLCKERMTPLAGQIWGNLEEKESERSATSVTSLTKNRTKASTFLVLKPHSQAHPGAARPVAEPLISGSVKVDLFGNIWQMLF